MLHAARCEKSLKNQPENMKWATGETYVYLYDFDKN